MLNRRVLPIALCALLGCVPVSVTRADNRIVLDTVVASVNGKPITLQDLNREVGGKALSIKEASLDPHAKEALDSMILEKLIEEEAATRRVSVSGDEVQRYLKELAAQNGMTVEQFDEALKRQGKSLTLLSRQAHGEILRTKLAGQYLQGSVSISEEEVDSYLKEHAPLNGGGTKLKISQILLRTDVRNEEAARTLAADIQNKLTAGEKFEELAKQYSEGAEAKEGGSLGILAQEELNPEIFDAVFALSPGQVSTPIKTAAGIHLFKLDERYVDEEDGGSKIKDEIRKRLRAQKIQEKMFSYFSTELPKLYSVERKL